MTIESIPPFHSPDFAITGPTCELENVQRLSTVLSAVLPPGRVAIVDVAHDAGCPCEPGNRPFTACTCTTVDVTVRAVDVRAG